MPAVTWWILEAEGGGSTSLAVQWHPTKVPGASGPSICPVELAIQSFNLNDAFTTSRPRIHSRPRLSNVNLFVFFSYFYSRRLELPSCPASAVVNWRCNSLDKLLLQREHQRCCKCWFNYLYASCGRLRFEVAVVHREMRIVSSVCVCLWDDEGPNAMGERVG